MMGEATTNGKTTSAPMRGIAMKIATAVTTCTSPCARPSNTSQRRQEAAQECAEQEQPESVTFRSRAGPDCPSVNNPEPRGAGNTNGKQQRVHVRFLTPILSNGIG